MDVRREGRIHRIVRIGRIGYFCVSYPTKYLILSILILRDIR